MVPKFYRSSEISKSRKKNFNFFGFFHKILQKNRKNETIRYDTEILPRLKNFRPLEKYYYFPFGTVDNRGRNFAGDYILLVVKVKSKYFYFNVRGNCAKTQVHKL